MKNLNRATIQFLITFAKDLFRSFLLKMDKDMKCFQPVVRQILILLALSLYSNLDAKTCTTTAPGVWDVTPTTADDLIVNHDVTNTGDFALTGSIIVNSGATLTFTSKFEPQSNSTITISGTLDVTGEMLLKDNAVVTVTSTGILNARSNLMVGSEGGSATLNVDAGGVVNVDGDLSIDGSATATVDGTINMVGDFRNDGSLCGTGVINYDGCSGNGDACGDSGWCDGSGALNLGPLPIELYAFEVKLDDNNVRIDWSTASEIDNDYFVVERSVDAYDFEEIGREEGAGNSDGFRYYAVTDRFPFEGVSYYRLKQVDFDGTTTYFDIKMVDNKDGYVDQHGLTVYPNPIMEHSKFSIGLEGFDGNDVQVKIQNMNGFLIYSDEVNISQERELIELETNIIQDSGMYVVSVFNDNKWYYHKFLFLK